MYKIVLADDHQIIIDGLKMILSLQQQFNIVGEASNGMELLEMVKEQKPDLIVSDLKMPGPSIIQSAAELKERFPDMKIVVLTAFDESEDIYQALDAGIDGYLMKDTVPEQIINTLNMVMMGYSLFQPKLDRKSTETTKKEIAEDFSFTDRENEVFTLIVENYSNTEIAEKLFISEATVKTHVSSILRKTGQPNRSQAVLYALKKGFVTIDG
ncbi:response regulator [Bacillus suaedaesalsae]|uniref:Response regulator transcription factor n=1 Tax=Bacillus suaedaesalsae TaxID=2810349 RepID=A0ABS2DL44_9BACI|nr:response regulator transcription factor [Bacillus suaedaesalsae]MBM6619141.1 response regulator transcription factor [Bacillus suaedaesalsae]